MSGPSLLVETINSIIILNGEMFLIALSSECVILLLLLFTDTAFKLVYRNIVIAI